MAMALVIIRFGNTVSDMGISNAIIQKRDASSAQLSTLFWLNILIGVLIFLLIFLSRHLICNFYNEDKLLNVISLSSTIFLVFPAGQFSRSLLLKKFHFKEVSLINIFSYISISSLTIYLAYLDFGVYSLVFGYLAGETIRAIMLYLISAKTWTPQFTFNLYNVLHFIKFGAYNTGDRISNFFNVYFIDLMIGSLLGSTALGYYALSFNIVLRPISVINTIASKVSFPILSSLQKETYRVRIGYLKIVRVSTLMCFPIAIGIGLTSPQIIYVLYGPQWVDCILIVKILAITAAVRSIGNTVGFLILSQGRADLGFKWSFCRMLLQVFILYIVTLTYGLFGACIALLTLQTFFTVLVYPLLIRPVIGPCFNKFISSIFPAAWATLIMAIVVYTITHMFNHQIPDLHLLILQILTGIIVYLPIAWYLYQDLIKEIKALST